MKGFYADSTWPAAPYVEILLGLPGESLSVGPIRAFIDTGADITIVPSKHLVPLSLKPLDRGMLRSPWGERRMVRIFAVDLGLAELRFPALRVVADAQGEEVLLGRDLLNRLVLTLDGPGGLVTIHE